MSKFYKLSGYTIKRYEPKLGVYFFFNVKNRTYWETDYVTGSIVASLDGTLDVSDIVDIVLSNNKNIPENKFYEYVADKLTFLEREEFIYYA